MSEAKENALKKFDQFIEVVEARIREANAAGKNLPATTLAREIGPTFGWEWPRAYQVINAYLDERPELEVKKGPKGGIGPKHVASPVAPTPAPVTHYDGRLGDSGGDDYRLGD